MDMQIVAVPLFTREMVVEAYLFRYQKGNDLFSNAQATNSFDGASRSLPLETLNLVGLDAFTLGKQLFVPINYIMLLGDLAAQCKQSPEQIIFLFEDAPKPDDPYIAKMAELCALGYRFAVSNLTDLDRYDPILKLSNYYLLSQRPEDAGAAKRTLEILRKSYRHLAPVATHIRANDALQKLYGTGYKLYESRFYKVPVTQGAHTVSPLKTNSIRLLNTVQDENFEFDQVSKIVQGDPALTISLMRMVNAPQVGVRNKIRTISHAVAMLGQQEVRKWVTTAVSQSLGNDRPNEITRISLIRAKFAENMAPLFEMSNMAQGLFLTGLFSVLDVILEVPMADALNMVLVSDVIQDALINASGMFYPVLNLITDYESANWPSVSRHMIMRDIPEDHLSQAYIDALIWYKDLVMMEPEPGTEPVL